MKSMLRIAGAAVLLAGATAGTAMAQDHYVEGSAGFTKQDKLEWGGSNYDVDTGWNVAGAFGTTVWGHWDAELELSYNEMEYSCCSGNNTHEYRLMANMTRNFDMGSFTPYVGGGLGVARVSYEAASNTLDSDDTVAAYQLIGGVRMPVAPKWSVFGEYRYQDTFSNPEGLIEWEHNGHNLGFGVRYALN